MCRDPDTVPPLQIDVVPPDISPQSLAWDRCARLERALVFFFDEEERFVDVRIQCGQPNQIEDHLYEVVYRVIPFCKASEGEVFDSLQLQEAINPQEVRDDAVNVTFDWERSTLEERGRAG